MRRANDQGKVQCNIGFGGVFIQGPELAVVKRVWSYASVTRDVGMPLGRHRKRVMDRLLIIRNLVRVWRGGRVNGDTRDISHCVFCLPDSLLSIDCSLVQ